MTTSVPSGSPELPTHSGHRRGCPFLVTTHRGNWLRQEMNLKNFKRLQINKSISSPFLLLGREVRIWLEQWRKATTRDERYLIKQGVPRENTFVLGITGQGRAQGTFLVAGNASVLCAKLGWLRAKGLYKGMCQHSSALPGGLPLPLPPSAPRRLLKRTLCKRAAN